MSIVPIAHIVYAVPVTQRCPLRAKNRCFQNDLQAAHELFIRVANEIFLNGQKLCELQILYPSKNTFALQKAYLFHYLRSLRSDMEMINNLITLLLQNPTPSLTMCINFWNWAENRFQLLYAHKIKC